MQTAQRKIREECQIEANELREIGTFDLFFTAGETFYHDVTTLFKMTSAAGWLIILDGQSSDYG